VIVDRGLVVALVGQRIHKVINQIDHDAEFKAAMLDARPLTETILDKIKRRMMWLMVLSDGTLDHNKALRQAAREIKHIERMRPRTKIKAKPPQPTSDNATDAREILFKMIQGIRERLFLAPIPSKTLAANSTLAAQMLNGC
jgi:hypothetical protein